MYSTVGNSTAAETVGRSQEKMIRRYAVGAVGVGTLVALVAYVRRRRLKRKDKTGREAQVCLVLGSQWGDEGKGKLVDVLAASVDVVARFNGGANAGHTLEVDGKKFAFHLLPCGMLHKCKNVIGNGVVAHLPTLFKELKDLNDPDALKRLVISTRAHLVLDAHRRIDGMLEEEKNKSGSGALGTTKRGIGPCYASKANRNGLRVCDLLDDDDLKAKLGALRAFQDKHYHGAAPESVADDDEEMLELKKFRDRLVSAGCIQDTVTLTSNAIASGQKILAEGANAALLDPDFGTYPYVTSSSTTAGAICTGLGIPPKSVDCVVGVVKAYTTRVGEGPFPTELDLETGEGAHLSDVGREYGTTTGRKRRCGWLDASLLRYSNAINGYDSVCLTKLDVLTGLAKIRIGVDYVIDGVVQPKVYMPASLIELGKVEVKYVELEGWNEDITKCTKFEDLPKQARTYLRAIEHYAQVSISWVGVGPGRRDIFVMP